MKHTKGIIILFIAGVVFLQGCATVNKKAVISEETAGKKKIAAQVGKEKLSLGFLDLIKQEDMLEKVSVREAVDIFVEEMLLSKEAVKMGLIESPLVKQRLSRELDHNYVAWVLKSRYPGKKLKDILRDLNKLSANLFDTLLRNAQIKYEKISYVKSLIETKKEPEKRREITVATVNGERVTLQDVLDRIPSYQEEVFCEGDEEDRKDLVLNTIQMRLVEKEFNELKQKYALLDEYITRLKENVLASSLRGLYLDSGTEFFKNDLSDDLFKIPSVKPRQQDLEQYYKNNPEKFRFAEKLKIRHIMVENKKDIDKIVSIIDRGRVKTEKDFINLVKAYSISEDKEKDGDLGVIFNPLFYPDTVLPSFIPWPLAKVKLFTLKEGDISQAFRSAKGYHILFVYQRQNKIVPYFSDKAKQVTLKYWRREQRQKTLADLVDKLKANTNITVDEKALKNI